MQALIISRVGLFYSALATYIREAATCTWIRALPEPPAAEHAGRGNPWLLFEALCEQIDVAWSVEAAKTGSLRHVVGIVDCLDVPDILDRLDFDQEVNSEWREVWPAAISMLVLAYPEVHWILMVGSVTDPLGSESRDRLLTTFHICDAATLNKVDRLLLSPSGWVFASLRSGGISRAAEETVLHEEQQGGFRSIPVA